MNVWKGIISAAAATQPTTAEAAKIMRCVSVGERSGEMHTALSAVLGKRQTWPAVSDALCAVIATAMTALSTIQPDPEQYFGDYLRPHINGEPWTWPEINDGNHLAGCSILVFPGPASRCSCAPQAPDDPTPKPASSLRAPRGKTFSCGCPTTYPPGTDDFDAPVPCLIDPTRTHLPFLREPTVHTLQEKSPWFEDGKEKTG